MTSSKRSLPFVSQTSPKVYPKFTDEAEEKGTKQAVLALVAINKNQEINHQRQSAQQLKNKNEHFKRGVQGGLKTRVGGGIRG